jgi:hypothetical protein
MMNVKIVCAITMLAAVPAAAETKSGPIRQELVHEYARKQIPLAKAAHAATYACHKVTSDCDFARDLRNTERCHNAERIVKRLGVRVRKELAKIKPPVTMDERHAIAEESITLGGPYRHNAKSRLPCVDYPRPQRLGNWWPLGRRSCAFP